MWTASEETSQKTHSRDESISENAALRSSQDVAPCSDETSNDDFRRSSTEKNVPMQYEDTTKILMKNAPMGLPEAAPFVPAGLNPDGLVPRTDPQLDVLVGTDSDHVIPSDWMPQMASQDSLNVNDAFMQTENQLADETAELNMDSLGESRLEALVGSTLLQSEQFLDLPQNTSIAPEIIPSSFASIRQRPLPQNHDGPRPGAVHVRPSGRFQPSLSPSLTDDDTATVSPSLDDILHRATDAYLVEDLLHQNHEAPIEVPDTEARHGSNENSSRNSGVIEANLLTWKTFWYSSKGMAVVFVFISALAGAVLAIVYGVSAFQTNSSNPNTVNPPIQTAFTSTPTAIPTMMPTTAAPSASPTYSLPALERIQQMLPNSTWDSITNDPTSYSFQAYEWLKNTTANPDLDRFSNNRLLQRFVLACLYYATNGIAWHNSSGWLTNQHECDWYMGLENDSVLDTLSQYGIQPSSLVYGSNSSCSDGETLDAIVLPVNRLAGTLPSEIGLLTGLRALELARNILTGTLQFGIANLTLLQSLFLANNQFLGEIPAWIGNLASLEYLILDGNQGINGSAPTQLGQLQNLTLLDLRGLGLTGALPSELGLCTNLYLMDVMNNNLAGSIPSLFQNLTSLGVLYLDKNDFTGTVGAWFWKALAPSAVTISLEENGFHGTLPTETGLLSRVKQVFLSSNRFTGTLPTELGLLVDVEKIHLDSNNFTGSLPVEWAGLTSMASLALFENQLNGAIDGSLFQSWSTGLTELWLNSNGFDGELPSQVGLLTALSFLSLFDNNFNGTLPTEFGFLSLLEDLRMSNNSFGGSLPAQLGFIDKLSSFELENNTFTGTVPSELALLSDLKTLKLDGNRFNETLPSQICEWMEATGSRLGLFCERNCTCGCISCVPWLS